MDEKTSVCLEGPRIERRGGLMIVGIRRHYTLAHDLAHIMQSVSRQWHSFRPYLATLRKKEYRDAYGICLKIAEGDAGFDYMCGTIVMPGEDIPAEFTTLSLPPQRYAVFRHLGHSSQLPNTYYTIFGKLLPEADLTPADHGGRTPEFLERFDRFYDFKTETGGPEILVPLKD